MRLVTLSAAVVLVRLLGQSPAPSFPEPKDLQTFYLVLLGKGPAWTTAGGLDAEKIQQGHLAHLTKLGTAGRALIAGPFADDGDIRGIVILRAGSLDEARALEIDDPAVKAGRLSVELLAFTLPGNWFRFEPLTGDGSNLPMRQFVFGFLNTGPNQPGTPDELAAVQAAHLNHLWELRQSGALVMAAPLVNAGDRRGLLVFAVDSIDRARALASADRGVTSGRFAIELHRWWAADGVMKPAK